MSKTEFMAFFLVGTTGVGKSAVAQWISERDDCRILSADSMLVYEGMDIGTAKPTKVERGCTPYYGIDLVTPAESFNVWQYREYVLAREKELFCPSAKVVAVGGTGLYVKALLQGLDERVGGEPRKRKKWEASLESDGVEGLQDALKTQAPAAYEALADKQNPRRLIRALECAGEGGSVPRQSWKAHEDMGTIVGLRMSREDLNSRIEARCRLMYEEGLLDEVKRIIGKYPVLSDTARQAIGYAEAIEVLEGRTKRKEAVERTVIRTRQLAKRQRTWFRNQLSVDWVDVSRDDAIEKIVTAVKEKWHRHGPTRIAA